MAPEPSRTDDINPHIVFAGFAGVIVLLAGLGVLVPGLEPVLNGPLGVFQNLTLLFLVIVYDRALRWVWAERRKGWRAWAGPAAIALIALVIFLEKISWGMPWNYPDEYHDWPFHNLRGLLALSVQGIPEDAGLKMTAAIAGVRIAVILAVIYAVMAAIYYRKKIPMLFRHLKKPVWCYAVIFAGTGLLSVLINVYTLNEYKQFGPAMNVIAVGALVMMVLGKTPGSKG